MKANIIKIVISYLIPTFLGYIIGFLGTQFKNHNQKDKAIEEGLVALLRNELIRRYREFEAKGKIPIVDQENIVSMFEQYEKLGGNGTVKKMYTDLLNLPTNFIKK